MDRRESCWPAQGHCYADPAAFSWFIGSFPYLVLHGHDPLVNNWLFYPTGVNLMDNASVFLIGALGAPITFWRFTTNGGP